jgi:hypothetical protein
MPEIIGGERWVQFDTTVEAVAGVKNGTQTLKPFRAVGGGIGLNPQVQFIEVEEHAGSTSQPAPVKSHVAPAGTIQVIASPYDAAVDFDPGAGTASIFKRLISLAMTRTSGVLSSLSFYDALPNLATVEYLGVKLNGFTFSFEANGQQLDFSIDLLGLNAGRLNTGLTTVGTLPTSRHWRVAQMVMQAGADLTVVASNRKVQAFSGSFSNNLTAAGKQVWYPTGRNDTTAPGVQELQEGEASLEGTFELTMTDSTWLDRFLTGTTAAFRLMAFHPDSSTLTSSGSFTTTSNPTVIIAEDFTTEVEVGDIVLLQDASAANPDSWKTEVLRVKTVTSAGGAGVNSIQLETDGANDAESVGRSQSFSAATKIFTKACQFRIPSTRITAHAPTGAVREKVRQTLSWRAEPLSGTLLGFMCR